MERAARIYQYGPPQVLKLEETQVGEPPPNEVRIRHTAVGINFIDVEIRRGAFKVPGFPATLGNEAVGVVEAIGQNVTGVQLGQRVVYANGPIGAYATARLYPGDRVVPIPDHLSDAQVASTYLKGLAARCLLKEAVHLSAGDTVLFHAAAGGVGRLFCQWATALGVSVIGTASSDSKLFEARKAGCVAAINYRQDDFVDRVLELTSGHGVKAAFDSVGRETFSHSLAVLQTRGTLVAFGMASGSPPPLDPFLLARRALSITWPTVPAYTATREELLTASNDLFDAIAAGLIEAKPSRVYALDEVVTAHLDIEERHTTGSAIILMEARS